MFCTGAKKDRDRLPPLLHRVIVIGALSILAFGVVLLVIRGVEQLNRIRSGGVDVIFDSDHIATDETGQRTFAVKILLQSEDAFEMRALWGELPPSDANELLALA
ncbi:MAG TPA: hypothetical protein VHX65_19215, partial [Pirellulales bacterium]|nr:hypothetical protein [Pirellulales bacterium]